MDSEEYRELLERVYRDEDFEKPRNMLGMAKESAGRGNGEADSRQHGA
jgi:hypothetical protein